MSLARIPPVLTKFSADEKSALELYELIIRFAGLATIHTPEVLRMAEGFITWELERDEDAKELASPIKEWLLKLAEEDRYGK